jgi:cell division protein ZapA
MAHINLTINGRSFGMECDDGQEHRVRDLGKYVDNKIRSIASAGGASNENHLLLLTALVMADEIHSLQERLSGADEVLQNRADLEQHEEMISNAINTFAERIDMIAGRIQNA